GAMEFCPVCLLRGALPGSAESGESSVSETTVQPTTSEWVVRFEHYELVTAEDGKPVELGRGADGGHLQGVLASRIYFGSAGGAGRGCSVSVNMRIFQVSPSRTLTDPK